MRGPNTLGTTAALLLTGSLTLTACSVFKEDKARALEQDVAAAGYDVDRMSNADSHNSAVVKVGDVCLASIVSVDNEYDGVVATYVYYDPDSGRAADEVDSFDVARMDLLTYDELLARPQVAKNCVR